MGVEVTAEDVVKKIYVVRLSLRKVDKRQGGQTRMGLAGAIDDKFEKIEQQIRQISVSKSSTPSTKGISTASTDVSILSGTDDVAVNLSNLITSGGSANSSPIKSGGRLKTGDFFITKPSNLSQSHVIFHLISDEPINSPSEITSRHPVIISLPNILKTASRHGVTTLTIPALLRHDMSEDMTVQCTLQLLLPHDISEDLFNILANQVPNVLRVANPKILVDNKK
uniref:Uncharacterized protein n=1 Tax=Glossina morsitans morsitans TaxID=37546 RepID=A0A1B0G5X0_GLOMM